MSASPHVRVYAAPSGRPSIFCRDADAMTGLFVNTREGQETSCAPPRQNGHQGLQKDRVDRAGAGTMKQEIKKPLLNLPIFCGLSITWGKCRLAPARIVANATTFTLRRLGKPAQLHPHLLGALRGARALYWAITQKIALDTVRPWGTRGYRPLHGPGFQNNVILTQTERLTMNSRPKQPKYARNKNVW